MFNMSYRKEVKKCPICGKESEQTVFVANYISNSTSLDLRIAGATPSLGKEIQECPHCHYCAYQLDKPIDNRYNEIQNPLEYWKETSAGVLENTEDSTIRKYLLMAKQYSDSNNPESEYKMYLKASWAATDEDEANRLRYLALDTYMDKVLKKRITELIQFADTARQAGEFSVALETLSAIELLLDEDDIRTSGVKKAIKFERKLIENHDTFVHSLDEYRG